MMAHRPRSEAIIEATAPAVGLQIAPEDRAEVARFLDLAAEMAAVLDAVKLPDDALDLAPVFTLPDSPAPDA